MGISPKIAHFNPRSHKGSDDPSIYIVANPRKFQSTLPQRERQSTMESIFTMSGISIHAPTKGATKNLVRRLARCQHFNPRSHKGSDGWMVGWLNGWMVISIHAPTKGATHNKHYYQLWRPISIHAPTKGATGKEAWKALVCRISIHAPTKGATVSDPYYLLYKGDFNPRSHKGSDVEDIRAASQSL